MASREVSLSWSGKGETHWGLTRKIGPWKTTPQDRNFTRSGGEHPGHANWYGRFNPQPYQNTKPPTKEQRYRSGDIVYNTMEYEPNNYEKYVYGSSKRIVMDRAIKDGIGKLGVKFVGPPSFSAVGSGTQIYNEGGHDQDVETRNTILPRYTTRPTNMDYIDNLEPPHLKRRRLQGVPNQEISAPVPFDTTVDENQDHTSQEFKQLKEKVQNEAMVDVAKSPARFSGPTAYNPPWWPSAPPEYEESQVLEKRKFTRNARYNPYSNTKRFAADKRKEVSDASLLTAASEGSKRPEKRKPLNQEGGGKKQRTGEAPTLKRKGEVQGGGGKYAKTGSSYLSGLGTKRKGVEIGGVSKKQRATTRGEVMKINTRVAKIQGPKIGKKDKMPIPERRSTRNKK